MTDQECRRVRRGARTGLAMIAGLLVVAGASGCSSEVGAEEELIAYELLQIWRTGDVSAAEDLFAGTAIYEDKATGYEARGGAEASSWATTSFGWAESVFVEAVDVRTANGQATIEWIKEGVIRPEDSTEPLRTFRVEGVTLLEIVNGQITWAVEYSDPTALYVALGGSVTLPDGTVLQPVMIEDESPAGG